MNREQGIEENNIISKRIELMQIMGEGSFIVPLLIILAVGIFVGTRIWIMFKKQTKNNLLKRIGLEIIFWEGKTRVNDQNNLSTPSNPLIK